MKILLIGHSGTIGKAVHTALAERGHQLVTAARKSGDYTVDITDHASIAALYEQVGTVDAVVVTSGSVPFAPLEQLNSEQFTLGWQGKALSQIDIVLSGIEHVAPGGVFVLTSGILSEVPVAEGAAATTVNDALEAFVRAAAAELPNGLRIAAVSPTILDESLDSAGAYFPGFDSIPAARAAKSYVRAIEGIGTGAVLKVWQ